MALLLWTSFLCVRDLHSQLGIIQRGVSGFAIGWSCIILCCKLTHWGRLTHIWVGNLTIVGSNNGLSPGRREAIIWTNAGTLLIRSLEINLSEILIEIPTFLFTKMHVKMSGRKWRSFCFGLNVLITSCDTLFSEKIVHLHAWYGGECFKDFSYVDLFVFIANCF